MTNEVRKVTKVKAALEDLLIGSGFANQVRNGQLVEVTKIQAKWIVDDVATLKEMDPNIFKHVGIIVGNDTLEYTYNPNSSEEPDDVRYIAPDVGSGRWVLKDAEFGLVGQYAMMKNTTSTTMSPGDIAEAADLEFAGVYEGEENPPNIFPADIAEDSKWRCHGYAPENAVTMFMRVV